MIRNNEIIPIKSEILVWARERIKMSREEAACKLKKDVQILIDWEVGNALPTLAQLEKLAYKVYKVPLAVFFMSEHPKEPPIRNQFRTISNAEFEDLPYSFMLLVKEAQYYQVVLNELFDMKNPLENPIFKTYQGTSDSNIFLLAQKIRKRLKINKEVQSKLKDSKEAFNYYRSQLEANGIYVFQQTLKDTCRGYSLIDEEFPLIIINSSEMSDTGKNFTIFHELSHLLFDTGGITNENSYLSKDVVEVLCNKLASNILVDNSEILNNEIVKSNIGKNDWDNDILLEISKAHKVSREVILRKLLDLNLTSKSFYLLRRSEWNKSFQTKRKGGGGNFYYTKNVKLSSGYTHLVFHNLYSGRINEYQASEYLGLKLNQISHIERLAFK